MPGAKRTLAERFWSKVRKADGCWEWTGAATERGYGVLGRGERGLGNEKAHRVSWMLHHGQIPDGLWVLHRCDNPKCVRPDHLFLGTSDDNIADMHAKSQNARPPVHAGAANVRARLVEFNGERRCIEEWARLVGVKGPTIRRRLNAGWPVERALAQVP